MKMKNPTARSGATKRGARRRPRILIVATNRAIAELCGEALARSACAPQVELQEWSPADDARPRGARPREPRRQPSLVVSRLADLTREVLAKTSARATKQLVFLDDLPPQALAARLCPLNIRDARRIHLVAKNDRSGVEGLLGRLIGGLSQTDGSPRIVDAWIEGNQLVLLSPAFSRLRVPLAKLARLIGDKRADAAAFEIDADGRFLHWPQADVHLGWVQLQHLLDPASAVVSKGRTAAHDRRYGAAIRALREAHGLTQEEIPGVTERHLRRVEHGEQSVTKSTLESLARAHALELAEYLRQLAARVAAAQ